MGNSHHASLSVAVERERTYPEARRPTCDNWLLCPAFPERQSDCKLLVRRTDFQACWMYRDDNVLFMTPSRIRCEHAAIGDKAECEYAGRRSHCNEGRGHAYCGRLDATGQIEGAYTGETTAV